MDKVDEILYEYSKKQKTSKMRKEWRKKIMRPGILFIVLLFLEFIVCVICQWWYVLMAFMVTLMAFWCWYLACIGRIGTQKWKDEIMKYYRERFVEQQNVLFSVIEEKKMVKQEVYNRLKVKYSRQPAKTDKIAYIVSIASLVVAMTSIIVAPLTNHAGQDYASFIVVVFAILLLFAEMSYIVFYVVEKLSETQESLFLKENNLEHVMKLLEDNL